MTTALTKAEHLNGLAPLSFTDEQERMIRDTFASGSTPAEFAVFMEVARVRRLNPITRQIHLVKRWNSQLGREVATPQTGIDGLRSIAERTGKYDGQDEPEFEYDDKKKLILARVKVYRKDWARPAVGVAHFSEYAQTKKDGSLTGMWGSKPHIMLAKCAESLALRKAFPEDTGGLYTDEEMGHPEEEKPRKPKPEVEVNTPPARKPVKPTKAMPLWQQVVVVATDYGFACGDNNKDLWAFTSKILPGKSASAWNEEDFKLLERALAETVKPATPAAPPEAEPPAGPSEDSDIPF